MLSNENIRNKIIEYEKIKQQYNEIKKQYDKLRKELIETLDATGEVEIDDKIYSVEHYKVKRIDTNKVKQYLKSHPELADEWMRVSEQRKISIKEIPKETTKTKDDNDDIFPWDTSKENTEGFDL